MYLRFRLPLFFPPAKTHSYTGEETKGRRDEGEKRRRGEGTKGRRDEGEKRRRGEGEKGRRFEG
jgi:hypothetical protein